ncbi:MAG: hypothetical protein GY854_02255 [Deltaproteobacteria bacterium]|nr:hypothetical protein [Deltaproteobacteria bacterium]
MADFEKRKDYREIEDPGPTVWEQLPVASWKVGGSAQLAFPVVSIDESGGNRIAIRERPYRPGAKLDDIGSVPKRWNLVALFENSIEEPGLEANGDKPLYPDVLNELLESFDLYHDEPGDLVIPTRGPVRARLGTYHRGEQNPERDSATLTLTFIQDNEDNVDAASFNLPSVKANSRRVAEEVEESAQEDGAWDTSLQDLKEYAAQLEGLINAPQEYKRDFEQQAKMVMSAVDRVFSAFSKQGKEGRDLFRDPETGATQRELNALKDMVGRETIEARRGRPQLVSVVFAEDQSLMSVAVMHGQSFDDLLEVNTQLDDPMHIPAGDIVRVFADAATG